MVEITSNYAANVGALVINLAGRGYIVRVGIEDSVFGGKTLLLQVSQVVKGKTAVIKETMTEQVIESIVDIGVVADAIAEKLRKS